MSTPMREVTMTDCGLESFSPCVGSLASSLVGSTTSILGRVAFCFLRASGFFFNSFSLGASEAGVEVLSSLASIGSGSVLASGTAGTSFSTIGAAVSLGTGLK